MGKMHIVISIDNKPTDVIECDSEKYTSSKELSLIFNWSQRYLCNLQKFERIKHDYIQVTSKKGEIYNITFRKVGFSYESDLIE